MHNHQTEKSLEAKILFVGFSKTFDSITQRKYGENTTCICSSRRNFYHCNDVLQNTKAMVYSFDRDTDFDFVAVVLQGYTLPYLFIICLDCVFRMSKDLIKENGFTVKKKEADTVSKKLWQTQITQMILCFLQIPQPKPNLCFIA